MAVKTLSKIIFGFTLSVLGLLYAFKGIDIVELLKTIKGASPLYVAGSAALLLASIFIRGLRWAAVSGDDRSSVSWCYSKAIVMGAFANQVLPLRVGEIVRVFVIKRLLSTSMTVAVATSVIDRLVEVGVLVLAASVFAAMGVFSFDKGSYYAAVLILAFIILYFGSRGYAGEVVHSILGAAFARFGFDSKMAIGVFKSVFNNFIRFIPKVTSLSVLILILDYLFASSLMRSLDIDVPFIAPLVLITFFAFGSALPSAPAYVGIYQAAAVFVLSQFGVASYNAVAVATLVQIVTVATLAICFMGVVWTSPRGLSSTVRSAVHAAEQQPS